MVLGRLCASNLNPYLKKFYLTFCQFRPMTVCTRPFQRCVCNGTCRWDPRPIHVLLPRAAFMYAQYSFCIAPFFYPFQDSNFGPPYLPSPTYLPSRHLHRVRLITGNKPSTWFDIELPLPTEKLSWKADDFGKMSALPRLWSPTTAVLPLLQQCHDWQMIDLTSVYQYDLSLSLAAAWLHREYARNSQNCKNGTASTRQNFVPVMSCLPSPQRPINSFQQALSHESPR